ncbi:cobyrinate a,c-diamide synthase [Anaeromicrobium sediminis]|uniref:Cobyrinate a,c-diamide synthase n=1 Tax=Anaeromicrobium sediminis TaxID=1478221 RepID=A0A267MPE1_9FIRM|nr:cobyrinate a,c-diamide synthase [Anaeromicrobium sediminis]PAB60768.1 cobyrinic acid a,c-diamide synthase [Anaeromicrobium sediminis]
MSRIVLGGSQSGVGKTTISLGIMAALKKRGLNVQSFKVGPDYIDPAFHTFVTGNKSRNLDSFMLEEHKILDIYCKNSHDKDINIIEGVMGLYDGFGTKKDCGSTAHISKITKSPVILIINGKGMSSSGAALVLGYKMYDEDVNIQGVIINNVSNEVHYNLLKESIERDTNIKCVGYLKPNDNISLESRHLGLVPSVEVQNLRNKIDEIGEMVSETIDLDEIINISKSAPKIDYVPKKREKIGSVNIAVAMDKAFNFYYKENLELLEELGANLIYFSPLKDKNLPDNIDGLYLGGGFPEVFSKELEENERMRISILNSIKNGLPTYAECGGFMYLCNEIENLAKEKYKMVGLYDTSAKMTKRLQRFGYVHVNMIEDCIIGRSGDRFKAHEFHRSTIDEKDEFDYIYRVDKYRNEKKIKSWKCGLKKYNAFAAYGHIHFYTNEEIPKNFIGNCIKYKKGE